MSPRTPPACDCMTEFEQAAHDWPPQDEPWDLIDELIDMALTAFGYLCALVVICAALGYAIYR